MPAGKLRDSKKLTPKQREAWSAYFKTVPGLWYALARVYPRQIEKRNISGAANLAAFRAFERLALTSHLKPQASRVYLDGGLYVKNRAYSVAMGARTIVKGDEKIPAVAIASIIAKVFRDRLMKRLAQKHPKYGFEAHKGYGTAAHFAAIRRFGLTAAHRLTFIS
jgi:ribonuclease HII